MIDEIAAVNPKNNIRGLCDEFKRRYPGHTAGLYIYGDATAKKEDTKLEKGDNFFRIFLTELRDYRPTLRISESNPNVKRRGDWINTVFEKEIGGIKVIIGDHCKHMITDLSKVKEAPDGTKLKETELNPITKKQFQRYGHFSDLFDYFMCKAFINDFIAYQKGPTASSGGMKVGKQGARNSY
jgi:hypothetical protein